MILKISKAVIVNGFRCHDERLFTRDGEGHWREYDSQFNCFVNYISVPRIESITQVSSEIVWYDYAPEEMVIRGRWGMVDQYEIAPDDGVQITKEKAIEIIGGVYGD